MPIKLSDLTSGILTHTNLGLVAVVHTGLSIGAAGVGSTLTDRAVVKDSSGRYIIPGSHLKGRLRHECEKLARALGRTVCDSPRAEMMCPQLGSEKQPQSGEALRAGITAELGGMPCSICRLFGNPAQKAVLLFSDLLWDVEYPVDTIRNRVAINRRRRVAEDERLFFVETTPGGADLDFVGEVIAKRSLTDWEAKLLLAGLGQIDALGGSKSAGLGWLEISCKDLSESTRSTVE